MLADDGYIHSEDEDKFREFVKLSNLKEGLRAGKNMLLCAIIAGKPGRSTGGIR